MPRERDAIIRTYQSLDWAAVSHHLVELQAQLSSSLHTIDPGDTINIARVQGQIAAFTRVLGLEAEALHALDQAREDNT